MECGWGISALQARQDELPEELRALLRQSSNVDFLADLAQLSLNPRFTDYLFTLFEPLFAEVRAIWSASYPLIEVLPAYARILSFAPHLSDHAEALLSQGGEVLSAALKYDPATSEPSTEHRLVQLLLGLFRLLVCDNETFGKTLQPLLLQPLLAHSSRPVRYLAIRTLCLYLHAADAALEDMVSKYLGEEAILGDWEGKAIDYRFLSLWEEKRYKDVTKNLRQARVERESYVPTSTSRVITRDDLSPHTAEIYGVLLPRSSASAPPVDEGIKLVPTSMAVRNLTAVARELINPQPLVLTGLAGSGKTLIIRHLARELNKLDSMVTLHLNEQSDAKLLIGMYTTGTTPGTFSWRPGVLTTAVREGRWVLIEDLDRAPNEVISTLLPLIESGELLIPSRGEVVRAARGFKIIATLRTTLNLRGEQITPGGSMIGARFWNRIPVHMPPEAELGQIISAAFPNIPDALVPQIMAVYVSLHTLSRDRSFVAIKSGLFRPVTSRDLFKWCSRITPRNLDDMFLEAVDCLAGSLELGPARDAIVACIAQELHVDPQKRDHLLQQRVIPYKSTGTDVSGEVVIGRAMLKRGQRKRRRDRRPFAANEHTRRLLERIAVSVNHSEPLLLVGETGTGKTTAIQHLASELGRKMEVFNLSQQSESGDLLGGFKPINVRSLMVPMKDRFDELFLSTFSHDKNRLFLQQLGEHMAKGRWKTVCKFWQQALRMVADAAKAADALAPAVTPIADTEQPKKKKRKVEKQPKLPATFSQAEWDSFANDLKLLESQIANKSNAFAFKFVEGNIVKAVRNGDWVLLDEINLAAPDTLEALADLLTGGSGETPSILLTETGNVERIEAHPNFRVFAAMNPATDVGKKDLPTGIRSRFTELYVESPDRDFKSLQSVVETYLDQFLHTDTKISADVANLYLEIQKLNAENRLVDGVNQKPHFSLRTLTRTLTYAQDTAPLHSLRRALYEGFCMSFLTFLDKSSEDLVTAATIKFLRPELRSPLRKPVDKDREYVQIRRDDGKKSHDLRNKGNKTTTEDAKFEDWLKNAHKDPQWLRQGRFESSEEEHYIITNFVWRNLTNLIRAASTRRFPVLIQGPTSAGKTSMIEYLAKRSGNKFVRINNHEHTDLQEYLGTYVSGNDGKLQFQEGILVKALREGHWIVLDELNLAPTDVLEALNRLLDDNRELLIPETQEVVRPHEDFMLFATQNPAGLYGGRKALSRAFRNRFLELHFDDIPVNELKYILERRTQLPRSWCEHIVNVYKELSALRQSNRLFEQKSFATLRDLFRWAMRGPETAQQLAEHGYMLLAERVRKAEERLAVKQIIEKVIKQTKIDEDVLYSADRSSEIQLYQQNVASDSGSVVWTRAMRRLYVLVANSLRYNEPVLLVGETGCGKTTVCQMLADAFDKQLFVVNAHQNTETGDLIGAQRPIRNRAFLEEQLLQDVSTILADASQTLAGSKLEELLLQYDGLIKAQPDAIPEEKRLLVHSQRIKLASLFEWADGSLVNAMKGGQYFLLDEISLADDSVLERLNSVLESSRTLLLAEKGPMDSDITASEGFQFLATMNPGGDYGKKELSPALRNRFTEIWVPALSDLEDITQIVKAKLLPSAVQYADTLVKFSQWFNEKYNTSAASSISIRDTLGWVHFINRCGVSDPVFGVVHGAAMVFIDTLGANPAALLAISPENLDRERAMCLQQLSELLGADATAIYFEPAEISTSDSMLGIGSFSVPRLSHSVADPMFSMGAPTTKSNAMRILRALQLSKPILLEGNPGVGKTSLVTAIAKAVGIPLTRINLSEQTDLMDLFGSDVPVEGAQAGTFAWRDAPFLKAMKNGEWVLLDEMNLASQSVLEGLNACLDHRGEVYVSELDQTFHQHPGFRVFAAQNPHHQGGGRKGLPASFVNRFTVVYADVFRSEDLVLICKQQFPNTTDQDVETLIAFISELEAQTTGRRFGLLGSPWEFNLRDTLRWLQLLTTQKGLLPTGTVRDFLDTIITQRFRTENDRSYALALFNQVLKSPVRQRSFYHNLGSDHLQIGLGLVSRDLVFQHVSSNHSFRKSQLPVMESLMISVQLNWPVILVGPPASGKTSMIRQLAAVVGAELVTTSMNADIDAMDLVGGYEQVDPSRQVLRFLEKLSLFSRSSVIQTQAQNMPELSSLYLELVCLSSADLSLISFEGIKSLLTQIQNRDHRAELVELLNELEAVQRESATVDKAQFQWVDGLLVQALEQGKWLVLDNANLCSSSVLDRLNSLLEPNGYLSVNEHSTNDGEAKIVRPHPNFRIFMTMDPRHGELSRAMRNRAVELFLLPTPEDDITRNDHLDAFSLESAMYRFRYLENFSHDAAAVSFDTLVSTSMDHLSLSDSARLSRYFQQVSMGLLDVPNADVQSALQTHMAAFSEIQASWTSKLGSSLTGPVEQMGGSGAYINAQPIHPLNNSALVLYNDRSTADAYWLAALFDLCLELSKMRNSLQHAQDLASSVKVRDRTRLGRSLVPSKAASKTNKDSMAKVGPFLTNVFETLAGWAHNVMEANVIDQAAITSTQPIRQFWNDMFALVDSQTVDEAVFQVYLTFGNQIFASFEFSTEASETLYKGLQGSMESLKIDSQLTTGLGMKDIWQRFKPQTPPTYEGLIGLLKLEALADRFDACVWLVDIPLSELVRVRLALANAIDLVSSKGVDAESLINDLETAIAGLEESIPEGRSPISPYFGNSFEGLCQYSDIARTNFNGAKSSEKSLQSPELALLAQRPTRTSSVEPQAVRDFLITRISLYLGGSNAAGPIAIQEGYHVSLLKDIAGLNNVALSQMDLLKSEIDVLGQSLVAGAENLQLDQAKHLQQLHEIILMDVLAAHEQLTEPGTLTSPVLRNDVPDNHYFRAALNLLRDSFSYLPQSATQTLASQGWMALAVACLWLYVPDRPFDPALGPLVERSLFSTKQAGLNASLAALRHFEQSFTGQLNNLRTRLVERDIDAMGNEPQVPAIARPPVSELSQLSGEFNNLLRILGDLVQATDAGQRDILRDPTLELNIAQIIKRLSEGYRSYDDITGPVVAFLQCLKIAMILAVKEDENASPSTDVFAYVSSQTPLLNSAPGTNFRKADALVHNKGDIDLRWHALGSIAMKLSFEPTRLPTMNEREAINEIFFGFYQQWKDRLQADQEKAAEQSGLYRYRGGQEEEEEANEEELQGMFPDYEQQTEEAGKDKNEETPQELARKLAACHAEIFIAKSGSTDKAKALLDQSIKIIGEGNAKQLGANGKDNLQATLPAVFLALHEQSEHLTQEKPSPRNYNFYTDANISEARKLMTLVHRIQKRFRQIRAVWPEHATLSDVIMICDELLAFRHVEPVAKFLTKGEKLHASIYEWQQVASKEYSAATLYDNITNLLISWRQLELTTWARLFDIEAEKATEDAKSWWFVAYENIVAAAESLEMHGTAMDDHSRELLVTLQSFLLSTPAGQYAQRLRLLEQFREHLLVREVDAPAVRPIRIALGNFVHYFARFEQPVRDTIAKGRVALEKDMKNVLKLASWRDRNIDALRQSAKTSHRKLFKLVRKFRNLLNQSVDAVLKQDLPEGTATALTATHVQSKLTDATVDFSALECCVKDVPSWDSRPSRFKDVQATVKLMHRMSKPRNEPNAVSYIQEFLENLQTSIAQLQKATPATLTEENTPMVKHLKSQKRKLFNDTLKDLREMGFRAHVGGDVLDKQDSLAKILSRMPTLPAQASGAEARAAEGYLHRTFNLMDQVREISREHNGDLARAEVARCLGNFESMLYTALKQRETISKSLEELDVLDKTVKQVQALWKTGDDGSSESTAVVSEKHAYAPSWLACGAPILRVGAQIVNAQAQLGKLAVGEVVEGLHAKAAQWDGLTQEMLQLPDMPKGLSSTAHEAVTHRISAGVEELKSTINQWEQSHPLLKCVLRQISGWLDSVDFSGAIGNGLSENTSLQKVSQSIFEVLDSILGSVQDIEKAHETLPKSVEEPSWLVSESGALSTSCKALHVPHITVSLRSVLNQLQHLHDTNALRASSAMFSALLPIIEEYKLAHQDAVIRFGQLHESLSKMLFRLSKTFIIVGNRGFCTPQEKSDDEKGKQDQLEGGTGLGEGEGAEDISKDIGDDEDLNDLAQEADTREDREELEEEKDAIDMGNEEMEGDMQDAPEKEDEEGGESDKEGEDDDMDEEAGDVDDLGPSTVDEKMWDDGGDDAEKDREGDEGQGKKDEQEQSAGQEGEQKEKKEAEQQEDDDFEPEAGAEEEERVGAEEMEGMDQNMQEGETLDLPDELNLDDDQKSLGDDESDMMDELDDMDDKMEEEGEAPEGGEEDGDAPPEEGPPDLEKEAEEVPDIDEQEKEDQAVEPEAQEEQQEEQPEDQMRGTDDKENEKADNDDAAETGLGLDAHEDQQDSKDQSSGAQRDEGAEGEAQDQQKESAEKGERGQASQQDAVGRDDDMQDSAEAQPFKKLGDVLENWYNQQRQIQNASKEEREAKPQDKDVDMADADFEHLPDEEAEADAQALGAAEEDQARALDKENALPVNDQAELPENLPPEVEQGPEQTDDVQMEDAEPTQKEGAPEQEQQEQEQPSGQPNAFMGEPAADRSTQQADDMEQPETADEDSDLGEVDRQLSEAHLDSEQYPRSVEEARTLWQHHESGTRTLSQGLTEHLRLILAPTLATKMRGGHRTGKRLNMKAIIPYIASQYKRDKIWLRRSLPSKRAYQIMLALDDSKSMAESASGLAFETLALVSKALAMLEAGEITIVRFGADVRVAHPFDAPFTSEAGVDVFRQFGFQQEKTDVKALVNRSIELFRDARMRATGAGADLWQLAVIISDGITNDHDTIARLVRQAQEERIMIVFVIVDAAAQAPSASSGAAAPAAPEKKGSVMDLLDVRFEDGKLLKRRYMDTFPFRWFVVVRDVRELPGVLSTALRQWFSEVVDTAG
ncbi:uncharacterized protein K452DRAFT_316995 [Aplosporella prunicola CBS 121167]|uniref:Midasin n=1 Tax=Aplosporella prunicola CBS 121167 TaxID=1176127 RepID=A0A6A6BLY6_9PEZI|nr:uncharacterized protein K452DRAFT_316995 [Aplosporella prunicola CBS 121167]KAF2144305.1 hypothetical protein K452DRAFT_316995 [Aplosporella prunicola CBS 121167]